MMMEQAEQIYDVLVVGAGPTGLTAAAEACRLGMTVRILDRKKERGSEVDSRALVVHPRVMELLKSLDGLTEEIQRQSFVLENIQFHLGTKQPKNVSIPFGQADLGDTEFQPTPWLPQYKTERILEQHLKQAGVSVEWSTSIASLKQTSEYVLATLTNSTNEVEDLVKCRFVIGCDGGRSKTRDLAGIAMNRTPTKFFLVASEMEYLNDTCPFSQDQHNLNILLNAKGTFACFPLGEPNRYRAFMILPKVKQAPEATEELVRRQYAQVTPYKDSEFKVLHQAVFQISHGVVKAYRNDRIFLAGDAAHVHSPLGGQGMNYGIQDAMNLMWKLAWVRRMQQHHSQTKLNRAMNRILDSYQVERRPLAKQLIRQTSRASSVILTRNACVKKFRNYFLRNWARIFMMERGGALAMAQLTTKYPPLPNSLLDGQSLSPDFIAKSGERLPNLTLEDGTRLYEKVNRSRHTIVVLNHEEEINTSDLTVHATTAADAQIPPQVLLVRPDLHVACVASCMSHIQHRFSCLFPEEAVTCM